MAVYIITVSSLIYVRLIIDIMTQVITVSVRLVTPLFILQVYIPMCLGRVHSNVTVQYISVIHEYYTTHVRVNHLYIGPVYLCLYKSMVWQFESCPNNIGCMGGKDRQCLDQLGEKRSVCTIFIGKRCHLEDLDIGSQ